MLGDESAQLLGLRVERTRFFLIALAALLAGAKSKCERLNRLCRISRSSFFIGL
ncbi:hypothetical protein ACEQPO_28790 [Bacillus sp. SL00103]